MAMRKSLLTRVTQPQEAAGIDWSNQITSGLVFAFDGNAWRDAVSGAVATPSGGPIRVSTTQGIATYFSGSAYLDFGDLDAWDVVGGLTVFWRGNFDATASPRRAVASKLSSDGTPFEFFVETFPRYIRRDATTYLDRYVGVAPTAGQIVTLGLMSDTDPHYANIAVDSVIAGAGDANGGTCTAAAPTTGPLRLGRSYDGSDQLTGSINCCFVFNRRLSSDEYLTLLANPWVIFAPEELDTPVAASVQSAYPIGDVALGLWAPSAAGSPTELYAMLDETVASDTDYIYTGDATTARVALQPLSDPVSSSGHIVHYRCRVFTGTLYVRLKQNTTTIATWSHTTADAASLTTFSQTLSSGEADSITDYAQLRIEFEAA